MEIKINYFMTATQDCSGLSTSENRALELQKKSLLFICVDCLVAFKSASKKST